MRSRVSLILAEHLQSSETERTCAIRLASYHFRLLHMNIIQQYTTYVFSCSRRVQAPFPSCSRFAHPIEFLTTNGKL
jgi:hypothetical protein